MSETFTEPGAFARQQFGPGASLERLAGDASARQYYRLFVEGEESRVLLFEPGPFDAASDFFLLTAAFLEKVELPVPAVLAWAMCSRPPVSRERSGLYRESGDRGPAPLAASRPVAPAPPDQLGPKPARGCAAPRR